MTERRPIVLLDTGFSAELPEDDSLPGVIIPAVKTITDTSYTILPADNGATLLFTSDTAVTIQLSALTTIVEGFECTAVQAGDGAITIVEMGNSVYGSYLSTTGQWDALRVTNAVPPTAGSNYFGTGTDGDLSTTGNVNVGDATVDGDVVVMNYASLTINSGHTLTTQVRKKGLVIYVTGNCTINGTLTMTARGAAIDPVAAGVSSGGLQFPRLIDGETDTGSGDVSGTGSALITAEANQASVSGNGTVFTIDREGASGGAAKYTSGDFGHGNDGSSGSQKSGGGGSGGSGGGGTSGAGAAGTCFSGGSGGGAGRHTAAQAGFANGGAGGGAAPLNGDNCAGGGAGNPGGAKYTGAGTYTVGETGTGGLLVLLVGGDLTIGSSGVISSNGKRGGSVTCSWGHGGGSSGGGNILVLYAGDLYNTGTLQAVGGVGGTNKNGDSNGGDGGDGSIQGPTQIDAVVPATAEWIVNRYLFPHTHEEYTTENGFIDRAESTLSFTDGTRTLAITPVGDDFTFWAGGVKYVKSSAQSVVISTDSGLHYIYFDADGVLTESTSIPSGWIADVATVALVYWSVADSSGILVGDERHGRIMDAATHAYLHETRGTQYVSGLALGDFSIDGTGDDAADAELSVSTPGYIRDEDIKHTILDGSPQDLDPIAQIPVAYRSGAAGEFRMQAAGNYPIVLAGDGLAGWNEWTGSTWQVTSAGDNNYVLVHILATNDINYPIIAVIGQAVYSTKPAAEDAALSEITDLEFGDFPIQEFTPIGTIIVHTDTSFTNAVKSRFVSTGDSNNYVDWRGIHLLGGGATATDHGNLSGLGDDDHTQYLLADGSRNLTGNLAVSASVTIDGRDISVDGGKLDGIEAGAEVNNISDANATDLTDAGDSTLHYHATDRARADHTGTQALSTISDAGTMASQDADDVAVTGGYIDLTGAGGVDTTIRAEEYRGPAGSANLQPRGATIADDATYSWTTGSSVTFTIIVLNTTVSRTVLGIITYTGQPPTVIFGDSTDWVFGTTNPDTDGKYNLYCSDGSNISIKNRIGSQKVFGLFSFPYD